MRREGRAGWQTNLILTAGTMATVFLALILAQLDALQGRVLPQRPGLPIVNIQATAVAVGQVIPLDANATLPDAAAAVTVAAAPDDTNPRPEFIKGVSDEGVIFTVCGEVPGGWLLYTVQPGESLASLAAATAATAAELATSNCLADGQVTAGMQILVPRQPAAALCGPPQWWVRYQVRSGDTLGALAATRGTTIDEILRANCRDALDLLAGQFIFLPPGFPSSGGAAPLPQPSLTPLPPPTAVPSVAPLPTSEPPTLEPPTPVPPTPTPPIVVSPPRPTATPPPVPTTVPTEPPPTEPPPTQPPPTPTEPPPTPPPPTPTEPPPTATVPPLPTDPPPTETPPTEEPPPTEAPITPEPPDEGD